MRGIIMKLKNLSTKFEYFTPKLLIFGLIWFEIIAHICIQYMNYRCAKFYTNISTNKNTTNVFRFLAIFFTEFLIFNLKNSNFWTYILYSAHELPICKISCFYQKLTIDVIFRWL